MTIENIFIVAVAGLGPAAVAAVGKNSGRGPCRLPSNMLKSF